MVEFLLCDAKMFGDEFVQIQVGQGFNVVDNVMLDWMLCSAVQETWREERGRG